MSLPLIQSGGGSGGGGAVSSVFTRTGAVVATANDYSFSQISGSVAASQLPNPSATTLGGIQSLASSASKWINAISTSGVPSATQPAFSDISGAATLAQIPTGYTWDKLGSAAGALTLANGTNATTFNQTANTVWTWANTTTGSAITTNASPVVTLSAQYWTGAASATDSWTIGSSLAAGTNGVSTLTFAHSGSTGQAAIQIPNGTAAAPCLIIGTTGASITTFSVATASVVISCGTNKGRSDFVFVQNSRLGTTSGNAIGWTSSSTDGSGSLDTAISRLGVNSLAVGNGTAADVSGTLTLTTETKQSANGAQWIQGQSSELLTLSTVGLTTDTTGNLLPANSIIEAVVVRVTTTITTTTTWGVGDATTSTRFAPQLATLTSGTTVVGLTHVDQTGAAGPKQTAAAKVRITCVGSNPGAGVVRITVFYRQFVAPTS